MEKSKINDILEEIYKIDPKLKDHELEIIALIERMDDIRPDTKFDEAFADRLRRQIMSLGYGESSQPSKKAFQMFIGMNKRVYLFAGTSVVIAIVLIPLLSDLSRRPIAISKNMKSAEISRLSNGAFGPLAAANSPSPSTVAPARDNVSSESRGFGFQSSKMILPMYSFNYVYKGDPITQAEENGDVYRRVKGDSQGVQDLSQLLNSGNFSGLDMSSFSNLKVTNLTAVENKDQGLMINFDFREDNVSISQNWEKWTMTSPSRLAISQIPADADLIAQTDSFLKAHGISLEHYGTGQVDNFWRENYDRTENKADFYIPDSATVIYPLLLNGSPVRDQAGNYAGLRVSVDIPKQAVTGLYGLAPYRYEASAYSLETSGDRLTRAAEQGGWNRIYTGGPQNVETVELGTPEKSYVQIMKYENNQTSELLVPALIFPVTKVPNGHLYFGSKQIIVPLVKEILDGLDNGPRAGGAVPMPAGAPDVLLRQ